MQLPVDRLIAPDVKLINKRIPQEIWIRKTEHHTISFKNYDMEYLRGIISMMKNDHRGTSEIPKTIQYIKPKQPPAHLDKEVKDLLLYSESDFQHVKRVLSRKGREAVPIYADNNAFLRSVLKQVFTPAGYSVLLFRMQIAVHMAKNAHFFSKRMSDYLRKCGLSFEAYLLGVAQATIPIDCYIVGAIEQMWNISISIVSPNYITEWKVYHDCADADIVVVSNGLQFSAKKNVATHYSATKKKSKRWKEIGHDLSDLSIKTISGQTEGKKAASKSFILDEAEDIMRKHYSLTKKMKHIKEQITECEEAFNEIEDELCEMRMSKDSFHRFHAYFEQLTEEEQKKPIEIQHFFAVNLEREKENAVEENREFRSMKIPKLKISQQLVAEERRKRERPMTAIHCASEEVSAIEVGDERHMKRKLVDDIQSSKPKKQLYSIVEDNDEIAVDEDKVMQVDIQDDETGIPEVSNNAAEPVPVHVEQFFNEGVEQPTAESVPQQVPLAVAQLESIQYLKPRRCERQASGAAPMDGRDPRRFYCDNCPKHFKQKKAMYEHKRKRCGKLEKDFKCQACGKDFHYEESLQDHLGRKHAQIKRHICTRCNEAFFYRKQLKLHWDKCHYDVNENLPPE